MESRFSKWSLKTADNRRHFVPDKAWMRTVTDAGAADTGAFCSVIRLLFEVE